MSARPSQCDDVPASVPPGYFGRHLHVDLNDSVARYRALPADVLRRFVGGSGLGTYLLLTLGCADIDALHAEAPLVFAFSPLVGTPITTSAKVAVVSKSPLTGRINDALMGGAWAIAGKRCGADAIVLQGKAKRISVLVIDDGTVTLDEADELAELSTTDTEHRLLRQYGSSFEVAVIGPAGVRQIRYATMSHAGRHAGRGGTGAVLGAKNIKAILTRGTGATKLAKPQQVARIARRWATASVGPATAKYRELGTVANLPVLNRLNALPVRNFQQGSLAGAERFAPESLTGDRTHRRTSCVACTIGCIHGYSASRTGDETDPTSPSIVRTEYENLFALGPLCGVDDPESVLAASRLCDDMGLDTISTGGTIAFAMECVERGLLDAPWLQFGSGAAVQHAVQLIAARRDIGAWLAEGSRRLAERLGPIARQFAPHVKGLELPGYEPRGMQALALGLAVGARGADHNRSGAAEVDFSAAGDRRRLSPEIVPQVVATEDAAALLDSLILCRFLRKAFDDVFVASAEVLGAVTGWAVDGDELHQVARRIVNAKKEFNIAAGWTPSEDTLPDRFLQQALPDDQQACLSKDQLDEAIRAYNLARGWTADGWLKH